MHKRVDSPQTRVDGSATACFDVGIVEGERTLPVALERKRFRQQVQGGSPVGACGRPQQVRGELAHGLRHLAVVQVHPGESEPRALPLFSVALREDRQIGADRFVDLAEAGELSREGRVGRRGRWARPWGCGVLGRAGGGRSRRAGPGDAQQRQNEQAKRDQRGPALGTASYGLTLCHAQ